MDPVNPIKQMEAELEKDVAANLAAEQKPAPFKNVFRPTAPPAKELEVEQLRDMMDRRHASATDAMTTLILDRDIAVLRARADLKLQTDQLTRVVAKKIALIEAEFQKNAAPLEEILAYAEKLID